MGKKIENNQLEDVKKQYNAEFNLAKMVQNKVKDIFNIVLSEDEIGFIAMFLCMDKEENEEKEKVAVLVAMHGESAATSIADVANRLLEEEHAVGYNMPLDQKPEKALENLIDIVKRIDRGKGVVLLVDMGSLVFFGDMIYEKTKIPVRTVEMVSTSMVLECTRKALLKASLDEVYDSCTKLSPFIGRIYRDDFKFNEGFKNDVILTACITGQGTALKLKSILEQKMDIGKLGIDIMPIEVSNKIRFKSNIQKIKDQKNVLAIISALDPKDEEIIYISTSDVFNKEKLASFKESLSILKTINNMKEVIDETIDIKSEIYIESFKKFYIALLNLGVRVNESIILGLILHLGCALERVLKDNAIISLKDNRELISQYSYEFELIRNAVKPIENSFNIIFSKEEYINVMKIVYFL